MAKNAVELVKNQTSLGGFQPTIFGPKTKQQMETYTRFEQTKPIPQGGEIQNGDTRNHQNLPPTRGVDHLNRCQGRLFPHTNTGTVKEISEISRSGPVIKFKALRLDCPQHPWNLQ